MSLSITPEKLRASAALYAQNPKTSTWAPILAKDCGMLADAMEIADSCARSHIECSCMHAGGTPTKGLFWDTAQVAEEDKALIEQELRYLDSRGLLIRKDGAQHIVSFKDPEQ